MNRRALILILASMLPLLVAAPPAQASAFTLDVLVDGTPRPRYEAHGTIYIEASRGREYALRLENPTPWRVAVALSVDGLNTIDARHTDARSASKWVIEPFDSIEISGWQVSDRKARRFYFTGENDSYGAALGQTENLGVIAAVVFRERPRETHYHYDRDSRERAEERRKDGVAALGRSSSAAPSAKAQSEALGDDYAATGMGDRMRHRVERVDMNLDPDPVASITIRYEFRPQLVKLGVLPATRTPLGRRERAHGFEPWCPEPK